MSNKLGYFGIYPDEVERVDEICQDILEHLGASDDEISDVYDEARGNFYNADFDSFGHPTNALIYFMFDGVRSLINKKYPDLDVDIYVNGWDSYMTIGCVNADEYEFTH